MSSLFDEYQIRRAADPAMVSFSRLGLPIPDQVLFRESGIAYIRADLSRVGDGYPSVTWVWDVLSRHNVYKFVSILDGETYASVRIRTDKRDGEQGNPEASFTLYDAIMWKPILSGQEGTPIARSSLAFQTVSIEFRKLVEV